MKMPAGAAVAPPGEEGRGLSADETVDRKPQTILSTYTYVFTQQLNHADFDAVL
jgi:hypothetical protein